MNHFYVTFKPDGLQISIHEGATLAEAAGQAGIILNSACGGKGICRKCTVLIEPDAERVLACQYHVRGDLTVTIPPESRFFEQKILKDGIGTQTPIASGIYDACRRRFSTDEIFGMAVDVGTTTVVVKLINMADGRCLATQADLNPQSRYGDDVISRIAFADTEQKLIELHETIIDCVNQLITGLCEKSGIDPQSIYEACVVGNTTMNHIFLNYPITQLGRAPYEAFSLDAHDLPAERLGLRINPAGNVHTVENIAGFVGSDTTAVAIAVDIGSAEGTTLVVDIGTNGEIVLAAGEKLCAASCAAGPALEGARITCGSRAVEGAIEAVVLAEGDIELDVIGGGPPRSICGSGLIDAVAVLLNTGVLDQTGRFTDILQLQGVLPPAVLSRITELDGQPAFYLHDARAGNGPKVFLTQRDIRQVQLAKAAIRTGIKLLQSRLGLEDGDIERILLAGAFGNYIRRESALRTGLLPNVPPERIHFVGNAACSGAQMILLSDRLRAQARELADRIEYIEIAHEKDFSDTFADSMLF